MLVVRSHNGVLVRLTEERWEHIARRHPEVADHRERMLETVSDPEIILEGDFGELLAVRFYPETPVTSKYLIVAYRENSPEDGFVLTAYFTGAYSSRRLIVWSR